MKKFSFLLVIVVIALVVDGILTYDLLEFKIDTLSEWLAVGLILAIICTIYWAEANKKSDN
ncbi:MAG: hypothetical protein VYC17_00860 [Nitrospinota bacterium]|nr:hypothetical protein [Nitrospinota bacterium]